MTVCRTVIAIFSYVMIISFIIAAHTGLTSELVKKEICSSKYDWESCFAHDQIEESNIASTNHGEIKHWQVVLQYTGFFPAIASFLIIAGVVDWTDRKENVGLFVSAVLACQSLVYLVITLAHHAEAKHILSGVLLNVLYGAQPGALIIAWVFTVAVTSPDSSRTVLFVFIEGINYLGSAFGSLAAEVFPSYMPLATIYALTFALAVVSCLIVYLALPPHKELMKRRTLEQQEADGKIWKDNNFGFCNHPFNTIRSHYIGGLVVAVGLTELARHGYNVVITEFVQKPPTSLSLYAAHYFIFSTMAVQGWVSIFFGIFLVKYMYASDSMLAMIALSGAAFWMALIGFAGSQTMLYVLSCCVGGFLPTAMATLRSAATKENDVVSGNIIMLLAIIGLVSMLSKGLVTYNSGLLLKANMQVKRQFSFILFAVLQLMAFILICSMSIAFKKPIIDLKRKEDTDKNDVDDSTSESDEDETHYDYHDHKKEAENPLLH